MPALVSGNENGYEKFYHPNMHKTKHPENIEFPRCFMQSVGESNNSFKYHIISKLALFNGYICGGICGRLLSLP